MIVEREPGANQYLDSVSSSRSHIRYNKHPVASPSCREWLIGQGDEAKKHLVMVFQPCFMGPSAVLV